MILENQRIKLEFNENTGAIEGLLNKNTGWQVIRNKKLSEGIRLLVPISRDIRANRVMSCDQHVSRIEKKDPSHAVIEWDKVIGNLSGPLDIKVILDISIEDEKAQFTVTIENNSPYIVEEAWAPVLGGVWAPCGEDTLHGRSVYFQGSITDTNFARFPEWDCGYWGTDHPTSIRTYPDIHASVPCYLVENGKQGIYFGHHHRDMSICNFVSELLPGYLDSMNKTLPEEEEINGVPVGFKCSMVRLPFVVPGETKTLSPAVIALYEGSWEYGLDYFRRWRKTWHKDPKKPLWENDIDCWMTLHISDPEGNVRYKYSDLPAVAKKAKEDGVMAIQLIGWAIGGQDGAEPYQDTNPLLGTREELKAAIKEIEEMGIRVLLMCKFKWCDATTDRFKEELTALVARDMYSHPFYFNGYGYQDITQLLNGGPATGGSRHRGYAMCQMSKAYQDIVMREFKKLFDLGSSGLLYDELCVECLLCYDTSHGHRFGESQLTGHMEIAKKFKKYAEESGREFMFAGEGPNDMQSEIYTSNYLRSWDENANPSYRYALPDIRPVTCLTGWDDREMVNQCITYGYVINFEPYNFKGTTADIPMTVEYAKAANQFRRIHKNFLWNGEFLYRKEADIEKTSGGGSYIYGVYKNKDGKRAVVISNQNAKESQTFRINIKNSSSSFKAFAIDFAPSIKNNDTVTVPARSIVMISE